MAKFEKLEEAQKAHDALEAKVAELTEQTAALNRENAGRRKREGDLEAELGKVRESAKTEAEKAAEAKVRGEYDAKIKELEGKSQAETRRLKLERAALAAGIKPDALGKAIKLLPDDVDPDKAPEPLAALVKEFPQFAGEKPPSAPAPGQTSKGGAPNDLAEKVSKGQPVELGELTKGI